MVRHGCSPSILMAAKDLDSSGYPVLVIRTFNVKIESEVIMTAVLVVTNLPVHDNLRFYAFCWLYIVIHI